MIKPQAPVLHLCCAHHNSRPAHRHCKASPQTKSATLPHLGRAMTDIQELRQVSLLTQSHLVDKQFTRLKL